MKRNDVLQVSYHERLVGTLALTADHKAAFQYSEEWLENGFSISPFSLPLKDQVFVPNKDYFDGLFDFAVGEREGIKKKPAPDSVYEVLTKLKTKKEDAVYIGDSDVDFATSVNAGMDVIMVGWGFRDEEFLREKGAKRIIKQPSEILDIILGED